MGDLFDDGFWRVHVREEAKANDYVKGMRREICGEEILINGLDVVGEAARDVRQGYREHVGGEVQQREISLGIQKRDGGGAVAAADVENVGELAIAKKILDGLGADFDVVAAAVEIGLRRFEEGFYFVDLGAHGAEGGARALHGGGYSNPERRGAGAAKSRDGNLRLRNGLRKTPARCRRYTSGVGKSAGGRGKIARHGGQAHGGLKLYGQSCVAVVNKQAAGGGERR